MKYKSLLAATALTICLSAPALADDITSPFYVPSLGEVFSETAVTYDRVSYKGSQSDEDFSLKENIDFGMGEEFAIRAALSNRFNTKHLTNQNYNNDINLDYELGVRKTFRAANGLVSNFGASYYTYNPRSWYGRSAESKERIREVRGNTRWYKELRGEGKLGYELEDGLMPYASLNISGNIDDADRELYYRAFAGVHKMENAFSYDVGLRYDFEFGSDSEEAWFMQAASDYFFNDMITVGGFADYRFAGTSDPKIDYGYTLGARLKILF